MWIAQNNFVFIEHWTLGTWQDEAIDKVLVIESWGFSLISRIHMDCWEQSHVFVILAHGGEALETSRFQCSLAIQFGCLGELQTSDNPCLGKI